MKRHFFKTIGLLVLLSILMGTCAQQSEIAFTYGSVQVTVQELTQRAAAYAQRGQIKSEKDYQAAIDLMIRQQLVIELKAQEWGLDRFSEQEKEQMRMEAKTIYEGLLNSYVQNYASGAPKEEQEALRSELVLYWEELGTTEQSAFETLRFERISDRVLDKVQATVTEDEIYQVYLEQVEKDKNLFENNVKHFEFYSHYRGSDIWFTPKGYRRFIRILLPVEQGLLDNYFNALHLGEDASKQRQLVIDSVAAQLDLINIQARDGQTFVDAIKQHSIDPYEGNNTLDTGYPIHRESTIYSSDIINVAFAQNMEAPGAISLPAVTKEGVSVLYYVADKDGGPVELNEQMKASISSYLALQKRNSLIEDWMREYPLKIEKVVSNLQ